MNKENDTEHTVKDEPLEAGGKTRRTRYRRRRRRRRRKLPRWLLILLLVILAIVFLASLMALFMYDPTELKGDEPTWAMTFIQKATDCVLHNNPYL